MNREGLLAHLVRLREMQLKQQAAQLRSRNGALTDIEATRLNARSAAGESIDGGQHLRELGIFGEMRLGCSRLATAVQGEIKVLASKVGHARKLAETAREARARHKRELTEARERSLDQESEHFFSWKNDSKRGR